MTETDAYTIPLLFIRTLHSIGVDLGDSIGACSVSTIYAILIFVVIAVVVKCNKSFVCLCIPLK